MSDPDGAVDVVACASVVCAVCRGPVIEVKCRTAASASGVYEYTHYVHDPVTQCVVPRRIS